MVPELENIIVGCGIGHKNTKNIHTVQLKFSHNIDFIINENQQHAGFSI
jgi:hypothetical protein